ncbi:hypothetical protein GCM10010504_30430 [Streptomyces griseus]|nr:hypothetical protein GCM10010504_30430 [Streptomyces griseus]
MEADLGGRLPRRYALQQQAAGEVDPTGRHVLVRRDGVGRAEGPYEVGRVRVDQPGGLGERDALPQPLVQQLAQVLRDARARPGVLRGPGGPQMAAQPLLDERQAALRLQRVARVGEGGVQPGDAGAQQRVGQVGGCRRRGR